MEHLIVPDNKPAVATEADKKFPVIELFGPVIQGEGNQAGVQTLFIRFGGCDYRCARCDSLHAVIPQAIKKHARYLTAEEIALECAQKRHTTGVQWVTFSGGNPAMHKLDLLVHLLRDLGFLINVETQGTLWQPWMEWVDQLTVSPKSPGMGEKFNQDVYKRFLLSAFAVQNICIKVVAFSAQDFEFALGVEGLTREQLVGRSLQNVTFFLSLGNSNPPTLNENFDLETQTLPTMVHDLLTEYRLLGEELLQDPRLKSWRFLPQVHVLTYGNESSR